MPAPAPGNSAAPGWIQVVWPDGRRSEAPIGSDWLAAAAAAGVVIPTGCLGGSCGACEIEVNGDLQRACIATVPSCTLGVLQVELVVDPAW